MSLHKRQLEKRFVLVKFSHFYFGSLLILLLKAICYLQYMYFLRRLIYNFIFYCRMNSEYPRGSRTRNDDLTMGLENCSTLRKIQSLLEANAEVNKLIFRRFFVIMPYFTFNESC